MTVIEFFQHTYPNTKDFVRDVDGWRAFLGRYGISGRLQTTKIAHLSEGQKSRIVFGMLCMKNHNLLLLVRAGALGGALGAVVVVVWRRGGVAVLRRVSACVLVLRVCRRGRVQNTHAPTHTTPTTQPTHLQNTN